MKVKFRKYTLLVLFFPTLFFLCFVLSDVYGIFWRREPALFDAEMRIMAANAINSGKFDSYILGTSMTENTSARELEQLFNDGSKFANISMDGGDFFERSVILKYIYEKDGAKNIVYSLDDSYISQRLGQPGFPVSDFAYLYDNNRLNNLEIYFSMMPVSAIGRQLILRENFSEGIYKDYDMPSNWFWNPDSSQRFGGLDKWLSAKFRDPVIGRQFANGLASIVRGAEKADSAPLADTRFSDEELSRIDLAKEYCRKYVIRFVEENPSTEFYVFFPPYSRIRFAIWYQSNKTSALIHQHVVRYFAEMGARYPNLHVFGFEDQAFLDDIALYIDTGHYHPSVNSLITAAMAEGTNEITPQNVDEYLRVSEALALSFDLKGLAAEIRDYLDGSQ